MVCGDDGVPLLLLISAEKTVGRERAVAVEARSPEPADRGDQDLPLLLTDLTVLPSVRIQAEDRDARPPYPPVTVEGRADEFRLPDHKLLSDRSRDVPQGDMNREQRDAH